MKTVQMFTVAGFGGKVGTYDNFDSAQFAARIHSSEIVPVNRDILEVGDRVSVEVHRGSSESEEGICTGGGWIRKSGVVAKQIGASILVKFDDGDEQVTSPVVGAVGYPYRNSKVC